MGKLIVEAEVIKTSRRADGIAIAFQSDRQEKLFAINLEGDEELKAGDRVTIEISIKDKPKKKTKKSSSKDSSNGNRRYRNG